MKIATENKIQGKNKDKNVPNLITNYITILGTHFYDRLKNSDKRLIEGMEAYVYINNNRKRHECSWCSKVCKYLNEHLFNNDKYYIYDSNVLNRLNIYRKYYKLKKTQKENLNIKSSKNWYTNLCNSLDELRKEIGTNSSRSEIEHILWGFTKYNVDLVRI